jgi:hypothetical protein
VRLHSPQAQDPRHRKYFRFSTATRRSDRLRLHVMTPDWPE